MVRDYKRKIEPIDTSKLSQAINEVQVKNASVLSVAKKFGICHMSLRRYCKSTVLPVAVSPTTSSPPSTDSTVDLKKRLFNSFF